MIKRATVAVLLVVMLLAAGLSAQVVVLTPTDALSFDYSSAIHTEYSVTGFEAQWDGGTWQPLAAQQFTDTGTQPGHASYRFSPAFTNGNHTVSLRACNVFGCGPASTPFGFGYAVSSAPTAQPVNIRRVPK
jgi:hypothetical protein